jgi:hypothetical protein
MSELVFVPIPVSPAAAEVLADEAKRREIGDLVSRMLRPASPEDDPLAALLAEVKADARAGGLTDADIDAELAAYNAERRR